MILNSDLIPNQFLVVDQIIESDPNLGTTNTPRNSDKPVDTSLKCMTQKPSQSLTWNMNRRHFQLKQGQKVFWYPCTSAKPSETQVVH